jgi:hypothetical protein
MRLRRLPAIDFVRDARYARDARMLQLLSMAMLFDHDVAKRAVDWAARCLERDLVEREGWTSWTDEERFVWVDTRLEDVTRNALASVPPDRPLSLSLSSGYDSRRLLHYLRRLGADPATYTFGTPGNLDFDFVPYLADELGLDGHVQVDANECKWSSHMFERAVRFNQDLPLSPRVPAAEQMDSHVPNRVEIHGHLGGRVPRRGFMTRSMSWREAVADLCTANDQFQLQQFLPDRTVHAQLPRRPMLQDPRIPYDRQLTFGYRQAQRMRPTRGDDPRFSYPFEADEWIGFRHGLPLHDPDPGGFHARFLYWLDADEFFEMRRMDAVEYHDMRRQRLDIVYGRDTPGWVDLSRQDVVLPANPTQHFDASACYLNNARFRAMVDDTLARLRGRRLFSSALIDHAEQFFHTRAKQFDDRMLMGLLTVDVCVEAGLL